MGKINSIYYRSGLYCLYSSIILHDIWVAHGGVVTPQASESQLLLPSQPARVAETNPSTPKPAESVVSSVPSTPVEDGGVESGASKEKSYIIASHFDIYKIRKFMAIYIVRSRNLY